MPHTVQALSQQLLTQSGAASWQQLADTYPWYAWAALGQALEQPESEPALRKTGLFVHHPLHLRLLLHTQPTASSVPAPGNMEEALVASTEVPEQRELTEVGEPDETPLAEPHKEAIADEATAGKESGDTQPAMQLPSLQEPADEDALLFQPYYTVDYFASQGIKADSQAGAQTRFDTQLRSFTQWLKTMKKVNYQPDAQNPPDALVQAQAQRSLETGDVVTESMVEVLLKQGKRQQALEVLAKLILLRPEKSTLFAAQIAKIKAEQ